MGLVDQEQLAGATGLNVSDPVPAALIIGIAGGSGSGKTLLAENLATLLGSDRCTRLAQDSYYKDLAGFDPAALAKVNFDHPDAIEWNLLRADLLSLKQGRSVIVPCYDYTSHTRSGSVELHPNPFVIVEGHMLLAVAEVRRVLDLSVFLDVPEEVLLERRVRRDVAERGRSVSSVLSQYHSIVRPMHREHVEPSRPLAAIVVDACRPVEEYAGRLRDAVAARCVTCGSGDKGHFP